MIRGAVRVFLVTDSLPDIPRGGLDLHVRELAAELDRRGVTVELHPLAGSAPDAIGDSPIPGRKFSQSFANNPQLDAFVDLVRAVEPDVVHFHNFQGLSHRMPTMARREGARVVWTHHDFFAVCQRVHLHRGDGRPCKGPDSGANCGPCYGGLRGLFAAPVFALRHVGFVAALQATHAHVVPSNYVRDVLLQEPIHDGSVHVLPLAVPTPGRQAEPPFAGPPRFVVAGDLREAKGADLVLEAFARLKGPASLTVAGGEPAPPAPREDSFDARLQSLAEGLDVRFTGRFHPDELLGMLDGAAALVVGSRVRETFGRTANLALQAGVPVVVPRAGAFPELVREGVDGFFYEPGDPVSLAAALAEVVEKGLLLQADAPSWNAPDLAAHVDGLMGLYEGAR
jgi:glycosyltransferase involved in cell wall biosynthesis